MQEAHTYQRSSDIKALEIREDYLSNQFKASEVRVNEAAIISQSQIKETEN